MQQKFLEIIILFRSTLHGIYRKNLKYTLLMSAILNYVGLQLHDLPKISYWTSYTTLMQICLTGNVYSSVEPIAYPMLFLPQTVIFA